ncbi:MAG: arsenite efflux transporter metallochaperone ArsD [Methanothrix sp.]|nr:arsenite efflux transporter metallochaperone ArsD [Methanothrix sp.]
MSMKTDEAKKKEGLLGSIWKTMTGAGSCCAPGVICCGPKNKISETEYGGKKNILKIYDPPMCCSSGVCGSNVNSTLVEFAGALKSLATHGIAVERWNLAQQPQAFAENSQVKELLTKLGKDGLPFIFVNDEPKIAGRYPKAEELFALLGIDDKTARPDVCCAEGCCK